MSAIPRGALPLLLLLLAPATVRANPADLFGLGGPSMGRGGGGSVLDLDAYSAWRNPGALGLAEWDEITLGIHGGWMQFDCFDEPISENPLTCPRSILWDGNQDGVVSAEDEVDRWHPGADPLGYEAPAGLRFGLLKTLGDRVRIGVGTSFPLRRILLIQQQDPYLPYYVRWKSRHQRLGLHLAGAVRIVDGLSVGVGVSVLARAKLTLAFDIEARVSDEDLEGSGEDGELAVDFVVNPRGIEVDVLPAFAPIAGVAWDLGGITESLRGLRFGLTYRHPVDLLISPTNLALDFQGIVDDVGDFGDVLVPLQAQVLFAILDFSTPRQIDIGAAWDRPRFALALDVTWHQWSAVRPNVAVVDEENTDIAIGLVDLAARVLNAHPLGELGFEDTWSVQVGGELRPPGLPLRGALRRFRELHLVLRAGYGFEPSFVPEQTGLTNFLDNDVHRITGGVGLWTFLPFRRLNGPLHLDLFVQGHVLAPRTHTKDASLVADGPVEGWPVSGELRSGGWVVTAGADLKVQW